MRTTLVFLLSSIAIVGCGGGGPATDIEASLVFADRSDQEILRLINAAAGTDMFSAEAQLNQLGDTSEADPCPSVTVEGRVATITGGCTTADGVGIEGSAVVTNPLGWDRIEDYDFGSPTVYEADALTISFGGTTSQVFDGIIRRTDSLTVYDADITVTQLDVAVRTDLYYRCTNPSSPVCTASGGIELIGAGGAHVTGTITADLETGQQTLDFTLQGEDRLVVSRSGSCIGWSIEGTDRGMTCP